MGKSTHSFVGSELSFLKLAGSVLVGLSGGVSNFSPEHVKLLSEVKCVFWPVDWN